MLCVRANKVAAVKAIRLTYSEFVFGALGIQHAMRTHIIVICGLSGSMVLLNIIS